MKFSELMVYYDFKMGNICEAVNMSRNVIGKWRRDGNVPFKMQCVFEVLTEGVLKADRSLITKGKENG